SRGGANVITSHSDHQHLPRHRRVRKSGELREIRTLAHLLRPYRRTAVAGIVATLAASLLLLVPSYLMKVLVDDGIADNDRGVVWVVAGASLTLVVATWTAVWVQQRSLYLVSARSTRSLQQLAFEHTIRLPPGYHEQTPVGDTVSRLTNDALQTRQLINRGLPSLIDSVATVLGALVVMLALDWLLALVTLSVIPLLFIVSAVYRRYVTPLYREWRQTVGVVTDTATESLAAVDLVQGYNQQQHHRDQFERATIASRDAEYRTIVASAVYSPTIAIIAAAAYGILVIFGGTQVVRGNSEVGTMVAFFGYVTMFLAPLSTLSGTFRTYEQGIAALDRVFELIDHVDAEAADTPTSAAPQGTGVVTVEELQFTLADGSVSESIELEIPGGATYAIVGDGDAGQSQLARLLVGLDRPLRGTVRYDGVDAGSLTARQLFDVVGYVSPQTGLFDGNVRDNLTMGLRSAPSDDELLATLDDLYGDDFAARLTHGLDTSVGRDGADLPAGTRQAVIIARAALRRPRIVVLDAATDSLDAGDLSHLAVARRRTLAGMTLIAATSQPLIADYADRVIVLDAGRIVEQGAPDDLLAAGGPFAEVTSDWRAGLRA
ncbi:MAG: ABC transporter ATP-binding protein, partial [Actinomycetota bacterium]